MSSASVFLYQDNELCNIFDVFIYIRMVAGVCTILVTLPSPSLSENVGVHFVVPEV